jgi:hypothetical protein
MLDFGCNDPRMRDADLEPLLTPQGIPLAQASEIPAICWITFVTFATPKG